MRPAAGGSFSICGQEATGLKPAQIRKIGLAHIPEDRIATGVALPTVHIDFLDSIPLLGPLLNDNSIFVYLTWLLVLLTWIFLYRTPYGFWMRAAGEHPQSLETAGINPQRMKLLASVLCGVFCGFAGAHLSLGYLTMFTEGMSSSRGFIAFACVIFGMANPPKVFLAALLFGLFRALSNVYTGFDALVALKLPSTVYNMLPYIISLLVLAFVSKRSRAPKAEGIPYDKGQR